MPNTQVIKTKFELDETRWGAEKIYVVLNYIKEFLIIFNREVGEPKKCVIALSPLLARELSVGDPADLTTVIFGVPITFKMDWLLATDNEPNALITISL